MNGAQNPPEKMNLSIKDDNSLLRLLEGKVSEFPTNYYILVVCKQQGPSSQQSIDFLALEDEIQRLQQIQQKTCEQIVQFVDEHCGEYISINSKFDSIESKLESADLIIRQVNIKVSEFSKLYYKGESKTQESVTKYETLGLEGALLSKCREESGFLNSFVSIFEDCIIAKSMAQIEFKERAMLLRFCQKFPELKYLFSHYLVRQAMSDLALQIEELLENLSDEIEFYISEQLSKLTGSPSVASDEKPAARSLIGDHKLWSQSQTERSLYEIKLCYQFLGKSDEYYKSVEHSVLGRQVQIAERHLINGKLNLIAGKNTELITDYFNSILKAVRQFPSEYPKERMLNLIYSLVKKPELKFLYTYTLPIFPISYSCYMDGFVAKIPNEQTRNALKATHNWDLKRWVDVRQKNILDRSWKDWQKQREAAPNLYKWIDIVFKDNCKISGVKGDIVKLAIKLISKYCKFISQDRGDSYREHKLCDYIEVMKTIEAYVKNKIHSFFQEEDAPQLQKEHLDNLSLKLARTCQQNIEQTVLEIVIGNTKALVSSCTGGLESYKSFIMKVIKNSKEITQYGVVNLYSTVFKPLALYLETLSIKGKGPSHSSSNQILEGDEATNATKDVIKSTVVKEVQKYYDSVYVGKVYQHSKANLSSEQFNTVMEVISKERGLLFDHQNQFEHQNQ